MARVSVATDDFNRASVGSNYTQWNSYEGTMTMNSSTAIRGSTAGWYLDAMGVRWTGAGSFTNDQYASILIGLLPAQDINYHIGVAVRMSGSRSGPTPGSSDTRYGYGAMVFSDGFGPTYTTRLVKWVNGTATQLHSASVAWVAGTDVLSLEVEGTTVRLCKNGAPLGGSFTVTDSDVTTGVPGVIGRGGTNVATGDDLDIGNMSSSSETTVTPAQAAITLNGRAPGTSAFTNVRIRQVLITESGSLAGDRTGINLAVWYSGSPVGAPDVSLAGLTTDPNGTTSWSIATGTLAFNQAVFMVAYSGTPPDTYTCGRLIPNYE